MSAIANIHIPPRPSISITMNTPLPPAAAITSVPTAVLPKVSSPPTVAVLPATVPIPAPLPATIPVVPATASAPVVPSMPGIPMVVRKRLPLPPGPIPVQPRSTNVNMQPVNVPVPAANTGHAVPDVSVRPVSLSVSVPHKNNTNNRTDVVRSCVNCRVTSTPLWRRSPVGPKTLCNACGVRMKKGRLAYVDGRFVAVESAAAAAKRRKAEAATRAASLSGTGRVSKGTKTSRASGRTTASRKKRSNKISHINSPSTHTNNAAMSGLYYLLAAIDFVEAS